MMGYRYSYDMMSWGGLFWLIPLIIIIVIAIAIYKITTSGRNNQNRTINDNSVEILKQRFARGEIDEEQYKKMKDTIESKK
ncbi:SHOCT domain-containing protein [Clostridium tyrobutyricum]|uniref:SHOCT domain-containing protein n=1 Tax=Clostridium tyrobutyricum TaxID=1519 RepID=UPI002B1F8028|nr:SHOCT domain-containing protein [Clostridium tyrobutyricum]MEA5009042.1 SHOCT domain-containing protein [Clostridium tyrobutyricum]